MINRLLETSARLAHRHPVAVALGFTLPCAVLALVSLTVPVDLSFVGILNRKEPHIARYLETVARLEMGGFLPVLLEGDEDKLDQVAHDVHQALEGAPHIKRVQSDLPWDWIDKNAPYLVDRAVFDDWLALATRAEDTAAVQRLEKALDAQRQEARRLKPRGARLLLIEMDKDPLSESLGGDAYYTLEDRVTAVAEAAGVSAEFAGLPAIAAQDQKNTLGRVQLLTPISLLLVLLLFRVVERRWIRLMVVALPMVLALFATLGLVGTMLGTLTVLESFFGVMVFGLGVDFALHLLVRLRDERARGASFEDAVRTTLVGTGRGVVAGGLTTAGAFALVATAPDPTALHLGVSGAVGLTLCLVLMFTLLPALWTLLARNQTGVDEPPIALSFRPVDVLTHWATRRPWATVAASLLVVGVCLAGLPRFSVELDLEKVFNRDVPAVKAIDRVQALFGLNGGPWFVAVPTLDEARAVTEKFQADKTFSRVESMAALLPADVADRKRALDDAQADIKAQLVTYEALLPLSTESEQETLKQAIGALQTLQLAAAAGPPGPDDVPLQMRSRLVGPGGQFIVYAYPAVPTLDARQIEGVRIKAEGVHVQATGVPAVLEALLAQERPWAVTLLLGILLFVVVVLSVDLKRPRYVFVALLPVVFGVVCTFGILCWAGLSFNVLTFLVVPLIIGLGVDDGIHVVHRIKEQDLPDAGRATSEVGKAIVLTTATTSISFGTLLFTDHTGMESMAWVLVIGLPLCLLASMTLLPAAAVLVGVAPRDEDGHNPEKTPD